MTFNAFKSLIDLLDMAGSLSRSWIWPSRLHESRCRYCSMNCARRFCLWFTTGVVSHVKWIRPHVETEYKVFNGQAKYYSSDEFGAYDVKSNSLDSFYVGHEINQKYPNLWELMKIVFVLSHGQASVELGFSVNKEVLTGNMKCLFLKFGFILNSGE